MLWLKLVVITVVVLLAIGGSIGGIEKLIPHHVRAEHNDVAGFVYAVLGVLYAVMLAFVVVNEWAAQDQADHNTFVEADELGSLYWNSRALPAAAGRDLEATTKDYAETVVHREWSMLDNGGYSVDATALVYRMRDEINALPTDTPRAQTLYDQSLTHINNLAAARRERLSESGNHVPPILWAALVLGALFTIGYTFLFGLSKFWAHFVIAAPLAVLVALALVLIGLLDHPFAGALAVHPESFEIFLRGLPAQR